MISTYKILRKKKKVFKVDWENKVMASLFRESNRNTQHV